MNCGNIIRKENKLFGCDLPSVDSSGSKEKPHS